MNARRRFWFLNFTIVGIIFFVLGSAIFLLYRTAFNEERNRLFEIAQSQARLIEAMARFAQRYQLEWHPEIGDPLAFTLKQLVDAHRHYQGFGQTGEFVLARRDGDKIIFLLSHRHFDLENPKPVLFKSELAAPMRLALMGRSGSIVGLDYRGAKVLAAYEPVAELNLGIVAKIDLAEIRAPFIRAGLIASILTIVLVFAATILFSKIVNPLIRNLDVSRKTLEKINKQLISEIEERRTAEDKLRKSERLTRTIINSAQDVILIFNGHSLMISKANRSAADTLGRSFKELMKLSFNDLFPLNHLESARQHVIDAITNGQAGPFRCHLVSKLGELAPVEVISNVIELDQQQLVVGFFRNIQERIQAEEERLNLEAQLIQSQKMEAIGSLAGGVAHDFNNLLSIILGYTEMTLDDLDSESPLHEGINEIYNAATRAQALTKKLLAFARKQTLEVRILSVNEVVSGFEKLIHRIIGEDIQLNLTLCPDPCFVKADIAQLEQILMNLSINSRDAMPDGGTMSIETAVVHLDETYAAGKAGTKAGIYVMISVSDTGQGMERETLNRIFEPFYTTKSKGKGTGLGLSTVYGIVKQHDGNIWVYSEPGQGTCFKIYLPWVSERPLSKPKSARTIESIGCSGVILLVEDDPSLRKLAHTILTGIGYQVLDSEDVSDAIDIARNYKSAIHLLLTDVIMPEMKGPELYQRIAVIHPESKVLYMSGYTDNVIAHHGILEEGIHFLQKPFSVHTMAAKVREVLSS